MKTLIAFFSRADENYFGGQFRYVEVGNTEIAAGTIRELTGADCFKIEMAEPYSPVYKECVAQAVQHFKAGVRPALKAMPESVSGYDALILAYPCYCGTMPMAVFTFLEAFDWAGKVILPLCTNEGSGMGVSEKDVAACCHGADIRKGLSVKGGSVSEAGPAIEAWLKENGVL